MMLRRPSIIMWLRLTLWFAWIKGNVADDEIHYDLVVHDINSTKKPSPRTSIGKLTSLFNQLACCGITDNVTNSPIIEPTEDGEYTNFTFTYEVGLQGVDEENYDFFAGKRLEVFLKNILNTQIDNTESVFHSFGFVNNEKTVPYTGNGKGECKGNNCKLPPSFPIPRRHVSMKNNIFNEKGLQTSFSSLFDDLKKSSVEVPNFSYIIKSNEMNSVLTYNLEFEPTKISPWKSLDSISLTPITIADQQSAKKCSVNENICRDQRTHIASVFDHLEVDFDDNFHECSWTGVVCDNLNLIIELYIENYNLTKKDFPQGCTELVHVTVLFLPNNGITGPLPKSLGNLRALTVLSLENNDLSGNIPTELGLLTYMKELRLSRNNFRSFIPSHLGNAKGLELLDLSRNYFVGIIPTEMGKLSNLRSLILYENPGITGTLPNSLRSLTLLENVLLRGNTLTGKIDVFSQQSSLKTLDLANNMFVGEILDLGLLKELRVLNLYNNDSLSGVINISLYSLTKLSEVILAKNKFNGYISSEIGNLNHLEIFDVADNDLTSSMPTEVGLLKNLKTLNLHGNVFRKQLPSELGGLENLVQLVLSGNKFEGSVPPELSQISTIEFMDIGHNDLTSFMPTALNELTNLSSLYIWGNDLTGDIAFLCDINKFGYDIGTQHGSACDSFDAQKSKIAQLYDNLNQDFKQIDHECEWDGIVCNGNGAIVEINLAGKSLDGFISTLFGELNELKRIDLSNNSLRGAIPSEIASLVFLENVDLSENDLSGDASFLCSTHFEVIVDDDKVRTCATVPTATPSASHSVTPSASPSFSSWSQVGDNVDGTHVALSENAQRLWTIGFSWVNLKPSLRLYERSGGAWVLERDFSSLFSDIVTLVSIGIDDEVFAVGELNANYYEISQGKAFVFREGQSGWAQQGTTLTGDNYFGSSVSLNGDGTVLAVAAPGGPASRTESVKSFNYQNNDWTLKNNIIADTRSVFGMQICLSGDGARLIVGAYGASNNGSESGSIYLYSLSPYQLLQRMDGDTSRNRFGWGVSMSRDGFIVAAGTGYYASNGEYVKVFEATDSTRSQYSQVGARIEGPGDSSAFGHSVSLSSEGRRLVVGAYTHYGARGKVFVYALDDDGHRLVGEFLGEQGNDQLGRSTAVSGNGRTVAFGELLSNREGSVPRVRVFEK